jgi:hypothetical protein
MNVFVVDGLRYIGSDMVSFLRVAINIGLFGEE